MKDFARKLLGDTRFLSLLVFAMGMLMSGCTVEQTPSGHTYVCFSLIWFLICVFTGPIGITINVIYVLCKLGGCSI